MEKEQFDWCVFNGFQFPLLPRMCYAVDGNPGQKVLFICDEDENIIISFEQDMKCLDVFHYSENRTPIYSEYQMDNKYLHQCRLRSADKDWIGFRMEITDDDGTVHICPGQMSVSSAYRQKDGVEPILIQLLNGFSVFSNGRR